MRAVWVYDPAKRRTVRVGVGRGGTLFVHPKPRLTAPPAMALDESLVLRCEQSGIQRIVFRKPTAGGSA